MSFDSINVGYDSVMFYKYPFTLSDIKNDLFDLVTRLYDQSQKESIRYFVHLTINRETFPVIIIDANSISQEEKDYLSKEALKYDREELAFFPDTLNDNTLERFYMTKLVYKVKNILREASSRSESFIYRIIDRIYSIIFCDTIK